MEKPIGKIAKRYTFSLLEHETKKYIYLVSFVDILLPDMEDYVENIENVDIKCYRDDKVNFKKKDKVYLSIDYFTITQDFWDHPENNFVVGTDKIHFSHLIEKKIKEQLAIDLENQKVGLNNILPNHHCLTYLNFWQDSSKKIEQQFGKDENILSQLAYLSKLYLKFDISLSSNILGNLYILQYNPYVKKVHVRYNEAPEGVLVNIHFRPQQKIDLNYFFCNKQDDYIIYDHQYGKINEDEKYHFIPLNDTADKTNLYVWDENNDLVYISENESFIMGICLNTMVKVFDVKLDNQKKYEKFEPHQIMIGDGAREDKVISIANDKAIYAESEKKLEFAFFDGSDKKNNVSRAQNIIGNILNSAKERIYICDPYFNESVLENYVFGVKNVKVNIKVIMEKTWKDLVEAKKLLKKIEMYNDIDVLSSISCKVLKGDCSLHDRYIVADNMIWLLGTSLNNIGEKISTIVKIPQYATSEIISRIENLWFGDYSNTLDNRIKYIELMNKRCWIKKMMFRIKNFLCDKTKRFFT